MKFLRWGLPSPALGEHTLLTRDENFGSNPVTSAPINTQPSSSSIIAWSMGWQNNAGAPSDNKGNAYTLLSGPNTYSSGGPFSTQMYAKTGANGGSGHMLSFPEAGAGNTDGEITCPIVEVRYGTRVEDFSYLYHTGSGTMVATAVDTTGPAVLLALWGGDAFGLTHDATPSAGWTVIESYLDLGPTSGVQVALAYKIVSAPGNYGVTWTSGSDTGAALYMVAVQ